MFSPDVFATFSCRNNNDRARRFTFEMSAKTGKDRIQRKDELLEARPITITQRVSGKTVVNDLQSGFY
ncbi:hypothetical protein [Mycobacterium colombiense]|uniref:hypothetical protein n=1 Tax=Mycobacterium colombiense TaxID=339268 RepID=UPI0012DB3226|nr:hypothetical protein [Mycobacterium colombiense]